LSYVIQDPIWHCCDGRTRVGICVDISGKHGKKLGTGFRSKKVVSDALELLQKRFEYFIVYFTDQEVNNLIKNPSNSAFHCMSFSTPWKPERLLV
jgi:hypothetical protein